MDKKLQQAQALIISVNAKYAELQEPIPAQLQADLEQMDTLHSQLLHGTKERAARLQEALSLRDDLERGEEAVKEWLDPAEEMLKTDEEGVDYENGHEQLRKHKVGLTVTAILYTPTCKLCNFPYLSPGVLLNVAAWGHQDLHMFLMNEKICLFKHCTFEATICTVVFEGKVFLLFLEQFNRY